jgi:hypothetical protein
MKQRVKEQFNALFIRNCAAQPGIPEALECMISAWKRFQKDEILLAWDHLIQG